MYRLVIFAAFMALVTHAEIKLPAIFSDHMVLQRGNVAPVWGWAEAGEIVTVQFAGQTKSTTAGKDGKWMMRLDAINDAKVASELKVIGSNTITVRDVLVGEVWVASGQSNMAMNVGRCLNADQEAAAAKYQQIRMFIPKRNAQLKPQGDLEGSWVVCSPETVKSFSGTAYFFGRTLHNQLKVPVGILHSSWGGTAIEAWTSIDVQEKSDKLGSILGRWKNKPQANQNRPANLFNGMIQPLIPYGIRGGIWYQGERNSKTVQGAKLYAHQLDLMINDWRRRWGQGDFPFLWAQLPNFKKRNDDPNALSVWAHTRESMAKTLWLPNTGMATTIDIGEARDIHPKNKQDVGKRLAGWALAEFFNQKDAATTGPMYASHEVKGAKVLIHFDHAKGLKMKGAGDLAGFAIAGIDKQFYWATATISRDGMVEVSCKDVPKPVAVRYAWGDNPKVNLINKAGLPTTPFRTDDW